MLHVMITGGFMLKGFREFISRGSVIQLAVGIVIGAAFTAIIGSIVKNLINPLVGAIGPKDLSKYFICLKGTCTLDPKTGIISGIYIGWGAILSAVIAFLATALVVYFVFVVPMNKLEERRRAGELPEEVTPEDIILLREIRDALAARGDTTSSE
jgi:large conductance mechanosensitive channel